jgi:hypothetical protein
LAALCRDGWSALALDKTGEYRDRLLHKQNEVLAKLTQRNQQEQLLLINLVSKKADGEQRNPHVEIPNKLENEDR